MSRIQSITTTPFRLEMRGSLSWGKHSRLEALEHVFVKVTTAAGHTGIAEAPVRPTIYGETVGSVKSAVHYLANKLKKVDIQDSKAIEAILQGLPNNYCAKGALDIALCEARAKAQGATLFELERGPLENIRVSFILGISTIDTMLKEAREVFEAGVSVFKIKIGRNAKQDHDIISALQHEFSGTEVILYADANEGLLADTAPKDLERLAKLGIAYVEEPLPVHMLKARVALKAEAILPIIADDSCFTLSDLERELEFDTFDILNIKTPRTGFSESNKMLELAKAANKGVMIGSQAGSGLATSHAALFASKKGVTHPSELSFPLKLYQDSISQKLQYRAGYLTVSQLADVKLSYLT
jgi:L-Ala-D/L-Glu epimerase